MFIDFLYFIKNIQAMYMQDKVMSEHSLYTFTYVHQWPSLDG